MGHARPARPVRPVPHGFTLVELLVVLVLLGLVMSLSTIGITSISPDQEEAQVHAARRQAAMSGRSVVMTVDSTTVRFLPDGREIRDSAVRLSGGSQ